MSAGSDIAPEDRERVVWQARPTARAVARELLVAVVVSAAFLALVLVLPGVQPWSAWGAFVPPLVSAGRSLVTAVRGRVVLTRDGIEVRRVLTRHYPWASLRSLTVEDDGRIEITPKGWVRKLPVPKDDVPAAFAIISRWRDEALASATPDRAPTEGSGG